MSMKIKESGTATSASVVMEFGPGEWTVSPRYRGSKQAEVRSATFGLGGSRFREGPPSTKDISASIVGYYLKQDGTVGQQPFRQAYMPLKDFPAETQDLVVAEMKALLAGLTPITFLDERAVTA